MQLNRHVVLFIFSLIQIRCLQKRTKTKVRRFNRNHVLSLMFEQSLFSALFESPSTSTIRPASSTSSDGTKNSNSLPPTTGKERFDGSSRPQSINAESNGLLTKISSVKILTVNGKCSEIFRSALEHSVEDCILQYTGETAIYVSKSGQKIPLNSNNQPLTSQLSREQTNLSRQSAKSARRLNSINPFNGSPQLGSARNNFSMPITALAVSTSARLRHQLMAQKFSVDDDIFEETTMEQFCQPVEDQIEQNFLQTNQESSSPVIYPVTSPIIRQTSVQQSSRRPTLPSRKTRLTFRDRQKTFLLSDLVMFGPEYYAHVFNLPRSSSINKSHRSASQQRSIDPNQIRNKTTLKYEEFQPIRKDLFHRYLWTQKPQVSCRICPPSSFVRSSTFVV